ncbi:MULTISPECIES: YciI family protein [unclassified Sinorhizobium]|uniref:YciI family protein n=1 Tax=unclassified Sinorhizobium TaxID=2613772 RepID=UPI003523DD8F
MDFLVVAHDDPAPGTAEKRSRLRPGHLDNMKALMRSGNVIDGGALVDQGKAIGSTFFCTFENRESLDRALAKDPFLQNGVWQRVEVFEMIRPESLRAG